MSEAVAILGQSNETLVPDGTQTGMQGAFAARWAQLRGAAPVLINRAVGGSNMASWARSGANYGAFLREARSVQAAGHSIVALHWGQGESDCAVDENTLQPAPGYVTWEADFARLLASIRADLGLPNLRVCVRVLGPEPVGIWAYAAWGGMQAKQRAIVEPYLVKIESNDLTPSAYNSAHFANGAAGYDTIGIRSAEALHGIL